MSLFVSAGERRRRGWARVRAMAAELRLDALLRSLERRESRVLMKLGEAAEAAGLWPSAEPAARLREQRSELERLAAAISATRETDRTDFAAVASWMQPVVVLRGMSSRALLRHRMGAAKRSLAGPLESLGQVAMSDGVRRARLPLELVRAVERVRSDLTSVRDQRVRRLSDYGGSALPLWWQHLGQESRALTRALWLQFRPNVFPRFPAMAGLLAGWWVASTYTDSHLRSALHSLGIGHGGRRVISGDTYRAMIFWLPILAAGLCAYLADRVKLVVGRRYVQSAVSLPGTSDK